MTDSTDAADPAEAPAPSVNRDPAAVMRFIANSAVGHYERLPMLDIIFDKMVRLLTESFLHLMSVDVSIRLDRIESARFSEVMAKRDESVMIAVVNVQEWKIACLFVIDQRLMFSIVAVMLGGEAKEISAAGARQPTAIEQKLAQRLMTMVAERMSEALSPLTAATFTVERLEMNPQFAAITRATTATVEAEMTVTLEGCAGKLRIVCPYTTLEPIKPLLLQMFMGEKFGRDMVWENHFERCLRGSDLDFQALLYKGKIPLASVADWRVGDTIELDAPIDAPAVLTYRGQPMLSGQVGQRNGKASIKVTECLGPLAEPSAKDRADEAA